MDSKIEMESAALLKVMDNRGLEPYFCFMPWDKNYLFLCTSQIVLKWVKSRKSKK